MNNDGTCRLQVAGIVPAVLTADASDGASTAAARMARSVAWSFGVTTSFLSLPDTPRSGQR